MLRNALVLTIALFVLTPSFSSAAPLRDKQFHWIAAGASCKVLGGKKPGPIVSGTTSKPRIFAVGKCWKSLAGYSVRKFVKYSIDHFVFVGIEKDGYKTAIYYSPGAGRGRPAMSDYVARYIKPNNH